MNRREYVRLTAIAVGGGAAGAAGYFGRGAMGGDSAAPQVENGSGNLTATSTPTETVTPTETATETSSPTETPLPTPSVTFPACNQVRVDAPEYALVQAAIHGGTLEEFSGSFEGTQTFNTSEPIEEVVVSGARVENVLVSNDGFVDCIATPTETPTETSTETSTATETSTETVTTEPTPTPVPIREDLIFVPVGPPGNGNDGIYITGRRRNRNPMAVRFSIEITVHDDDGTELETVTTGPYQMAPYSDWADWQLFYDGPRSDEAASTLALPRSDPRLTSSDFSSRPIGVERWEDY